MKNKSPYKICPVCDVEVCLVEDRACRKCDKDIRVAASYHHNRRVIEKCITGNNPIDWSKAYD
jgi:hypothetical protein